MALHVSRAELAKRRRRACRAMIERGLDGLLLFRRRRSLGQPVADGQRAGGVAGPPSHGRDLRGDG